FHIAEKNFSSVHQIPRYPTPIRYLSHGSPFIYLTSLQAGLTLPIFDSGRLNANLDIAKAESNLSIASYNKAVVEAVNDVARAASQVQTLAEKNQHQAQIERDALRVVGLAQARFNAGIIAGSRVSEARIPALRERANGLLLQGQWLDASIQLTGALGGGYKR
ncbi:TolC family protein, partial [Escherichia coli]|nr:TolC family protein [Escherichia coli]